MKKKFEMGGKAQAKSSLLKLSIIFAVALMLSFCIIPALDNNEDNESSAAQTSDALDVIIQKTVAEIAASGGIAIYNISELQQIGSAGILPMNGTYYLADDIEVSGINNFVPLGTSSSPFTGTFDGNGYTIKGINMTRTGDVGLFGYTSGAVIRNVAMEAGSLTSSGNGSAIAYAGAIVARAMDGTAILNCYNTGTVTGESFVGGIAGDGVDCKIERCYNTGSILINGTQTSVYAAGIIGGISGGSVKMCYNTGSVTVTLSVASTASSCAAGVAMRATSGTDVANCYNTGTITGGTVYGVYGSPSAGGTVSYCYNVGGLVATVGTAYGISYEGNDNYYLDTCGNTASAVGNLSKTSSELKVWDTFIGWDYNTIWTIDPIENTGYPILRPSMPELIFITEQPADDYMDERSNAVFSVTAVGSIPGVNMTYKWEASRDNGTTWSNAIDGAGRDTSLLMASPSDYTAGVDLFRCVIDGMYGIIPLAQVITDEVTFYVTGTPGGTVHYVNDAEDLRHIGLGNWNKNTVPQGDWAPNHTYIQTNNIDLRPLTASAAERIEVEITAITPGPSGSVEFTFTRYSATAQALPTNMNVAFGTYYGTNVALSSDKITVNNSDSGYDGSKPITAMFTVAVSFVLSIEVYSGHLNDTSQAPIGGNVSLSGVFSGKYDGNGYEIIGLNSIEGGLFYELGGIGSIVENLTLWGGEVAGTSFAGGIVGRAGNTSVVNIVNCNNVFSGAAGTRAGGIVGSTLSIANVTNITNCFNTGTIYGGQAGGMGGYIGGPITNSFNKGSIIGYGDYVGGIAGYTGTGSTIQNCGNEGDVIAAPYVASSVNGGLGGILGSSASGTTNVTGCYNAGNVSVIHRSNSNSFSVGGIVGAADSGDVYIADCYNVGYITIADTSYTSNILAMGGIVGSIKNGSINHCYNMGDIESSENGSITNEISAGGIAGRSRVNVGNSYNTGNINLTTSVGTAVTGGIIAYVETQAAIIYSYNTGMISALNSTNGTAGGIVGISNNQPSSIKFCYNIGAIHAATNAGGIAAVYEYTISDCYNTGIVTATNNQAGGFVANSTSAQITDSYTTGKGNGNAIVGTGTVTTTDVFYIQGTLPSPGGVGTSVIASKLTLAGTFSSWVNFPTEWALPFITINNGYPVLTGTPWSGVDASFIVHPGDKLAEDGGNATFVAIATGSVTGYQWQISTNNGSTWANIPGEKSPMLRLFGVVLSDDGNLYRCIVTDSNGKILNSRIATLTVVSDIFTIQTVTDMTESGPGTGGYVHPHENRFVDSRQRNVDVAGGKQVIFDIIPRDWDDFSLISLKWGTTELFGVPTPMGITLVENSDGSHTLTIDAVTADQTLTAVFGYGYNIDVTITGGTGGDVDWAYDGGITSGTISGSGGTISSIPPGENVDIEFVPDVYYIIQSVLIDGVENPVAVSSGQYTFTSIGQAHTVQVTFVKVEILITEEPVDDFIDERSNAAFQVTAVGSIPGITLTYAWEVSTNNGLNWSTAINGLGLTTPMLMVSPSDYDAGIDLFRCKISGTYNGMPLDEVITNEVMFNAYATVHYVTDAEDLQAVGNGPYMKGGTVDMGIWAFDHTYIQVADIVFPEIIVFDTDSRRVTIASMDSTSVTFLLETYESGSWQAETSGNVYVAFGEQLVTNPSLVLGQITVSNADSGYDGTSAIDAVIYNIDANNNYGMAIKVSSGSVGQYVVASVGGNYKTIGANSFTFTGNYDGNGWLIDRLNVVSPSTCGGLFSDARGGSLRNMWIGENSVIIANGGGAIANIITDVEASNLINEGVVLSIVGGGVVGGIFASSVDSTMVNCINEGTICGNREAAGIVYSVSSSTIDSCYNKGTIVTYNLGTAGGIVGVSGGNPGKPETIIFNCYNAGDIFTQSDAGGILGSQNGVKPVTILNCHNSGNIVATGFGWTAIGGIAGYMMTDCYIIDCYNEGNITNLASNSSVTGGILGRCFQVGIIEGCYNKGNITNATTFVCYTGGIFGTISGNMPVVNCYNAGNVTGTSNVGGIGGALQSSSPISNCYNWGNISATSDYGGIVGNRSGSGTINESFYLDLSAVGSNTHGVSKTEGQLRDINTYSDPSWDFATVWVDNSGNLSINNGFPTLRGTFPVLEIVSHPADRTVEENSDVSFRVMAIGNGPKYQWQVNGGSSWSDIFGADMPVLTLNSVQISSHNGNLYRCVITDSDGNTISSRAATLTVVLDMYTIYTKTEMSKTGPGTGGYVYPVAAPNVYPDKRDTNVVGGNSVTYDIIPRPGFKLAALTLDGNDQMSSASLVDVGGGNYTYTITSVSADHILIATFSDGYDVVVTMNGNTTSTVNWSYGTGSGESGTIPAAGGTIQNVPDGKVITFTYVLSGGDVFVSWGGDLGNVYFNNQTLTVDSAKTVVANFGTASNTWELKLNLGTGKATVAYDSLTVEFTGNGNIINIPDGKAVTVTSTANPPTGELFAYWYGNENYDTAAFTIPNTNTANKEYTARYVSSSDAVTINVASLPVGAKFYYRAAPTSGELPMGYSQMTGTSITVHKNDIVHLDTEATFTFSSATWTFSRWMEGTADVTNARQHKITDLSTGASSRTFTAIFVLNPLVITFASDPTSIPGLEFKYKSPGSGTYATLVGTTATFDVSEAIAIEVSSFGTYEFLRWQDGTGTVLGTTALLTSVSLSAYSGSVTFTAIFVAAGDSVTITLSSYPAGAGTFEYGFTSTGPWTTYTMPFKISKTEDLTIITAQASGYTFRFWEDASTATSRNVGTHTVNTEYTAYFLSTTPSDKVMITLTANPSGAGTFEYSLPGMTANVTYTTAFDVNKTDDLTIITAATGVYTFQQWEDLSTATTRNVGTHTVNAEYIANFLGSSTSKLTLSAYPTGAGTFEYMTSGMIGYATYLGEITVNTGETVSIRTAPVSGYTFRFWEDASTAATRNVTVDSDMTCTAYFLSTTPSDTVTITLTAYPAGAGTFEYSLPGMTANVTYTTAFDVNKTDNLTVITAQASGYTFENWEDMSVSEVRNVGTHNDNTEYVAYFTKDIMPQSKYVITSSSDANSSISPEGRTIVSYGGDITYYFEADSNYKISRIVIDGEERPELISVGSYTFKHVNMNHSIIVYSTYNEGSISMTIEIDGDGLVEYTIGSVTTVTYGGTFWFERGTDVSLKAFASENNHFVVWKTGSSIYTNIEVEFNNIGASMIVTAEFDEDSGSDLGWLWWLLLVIAAVIVASLIMWFIFFQRRAYEVIKVESIGLTIEGKDKARRNRPYRFTVIGNPRIIEYIIGEEGSPKTLSPDINNEYEIPKGEVKDKVTIRSK